MLNKDEYSTVFIYQLVFHNTVITSNFYLLRIFIFILLLLAVTPARLAKQVLFLAASVLVSVSLCVCPHKKN